MTALDDKLLGRDELLKVLPEGWPGLSKALDLLERGKSDPLAVSIVRKLLASAAVELRIADDAAKRRALLDFLGGAVVTREAHEARVSELLAANSALVHENRRLRRLI